MLWVMSHPSLRVTESARESVLAVTRQLTVLRDLSRGFNELLTPDGYNPKTKRGRARGYSTAILHFAPGHRSGYEVCGGLNDGSKDHGRSAGCTFGCLNTAGHGGILLDADDLNAVQRARIARTRMMFLDRFAFNALLVANTESHIRRARKHGLTPVERPNGTSDLPWEWLRLNDGRTLLETFSDVQFYDYTKSARRALAFARGQMPGNYHLTFSRSEVNDADCERVLAAGGNVAVVMKICDCRRACHHEIPAGLTYMGYPVINGDADDLRFLDPAGVVVGLKAKGRAKSDTTGFVVDMTDAIRALSPDVVSLKGTARAA